MIGFILITTRPNKEVDILHALRDIPEIEEVNPLFGEYDLIAKVTVKDFKTLGIIVADKIRCLDGVLDTKTLSGGTVR